jgi:hypothetical protein
METEIVNRLGNSFSRAPLAAVVGLCTAVAIFACFPLGELLFFHMLLIKKVSGKETSSDISYSTHNTDNFLTVRYHGKTFKR